MTLTEIVKEKLSDEQVKMRVAIDLNISYASIHRWIKSDDIRLTTINAIESICKHTKVSKNELFETQTKKVNS